MAPGAEEEESSSRPAPPGGIIQEPQALQLPGSRVHYIGSSLRLCFPGLDHCLVFPSRFLCGFTHTTPTLPVISVPSHTFGLISGVFFGKISPGCLGRSRLAWSPCHLGSPYTSLCSIPSLLGLVSSSVCLGGVYPLVGS